MQSEFENYAVPNVTSRDIVPLGLQRSVSSGSATRVLGTYIDQRVLRHGRETIICSRLTAANNSLAINNDIHRSVLRKCETTDACFERGEMNNGLY